MNFHTLNIKNIVAKYPGVISEIKSKSFPSMDGHESYNYVDVFSTAKKYDTSLNPLKKELLNYFFEKSESVILVSNHYFSYVSKHRPDLLQNTSVWECEFFMKQKEESSITSLKQFLLQPEKKQNIENSQENMSWAA